MSVHSIMGEDRFLTTLEVAELFGVKKRTISKWVKAGKLTAIKPGDGVLRFRESIVLALLIEEGRTDNSLTKT